MLSPTRPRRSLARRATDTIGWLVVVLVVAVSGAGLVLTFDHPQNDAGRPELTAVGDAIVGPRLAALEPAATQISADADAIAEQARTLYGHLRTRDTKSARADLQAGDALVAAVADHLAPLTAARDGLLDGTSAHAISGANRDRVAALRAAADAGGQLAGTWEAIAVAAARTYPVVDALALHDAAVLEATGHARASDFSAALASLAVASTELDNVRAMAANAAAAGRDTGTLSGLIDRDAAYDAALARLYGILAGNGGQMTADAQAAYATVQAAESALPDNDSAMTVIVSDLGGQAVTLGLIALDQLRGAIEGALPSPLPSVTPG